MKVFAVCGYSKSGKTTTIVNIIPKLIEQGYSVGTVKDIHYQQFTMDTNGKNTYLHREAGASIVTARGIAETDILNYRSMSLAEILTSYNTDFVVVEGMRDQPLPKIITADSLEQLEELVDDTTFAISGVISNQIDTYNGIPVIDSNSSVDILMQLIYDKVFDVLPLMDKECCDQCGGDCYQLCKQIVQGNASRKDCLISQSKVVVTIDGKPIDMAPFVQNIVINNVLAIASELRGYKRGKQIVVKIKETT